MKTLWLLTTSLALALGQAHPQATQPPSPQPEFEVASIRTVAPLSEEDLRRGLGNVPWSTFPTSRFTGHRITLRILIDLAYGVDDKYIEGDPDWLSSQQYSIDAKVEGDKELTYKQMQPLLQHLLEERFRLVTHRVTKPTSGYAFIVTKGGPKLIPAKESVPFHIQTVPSGLQVQSIDMEHFVQVLSLPAGYPVADKTGIQGSYDFTLDYVPANDPNSSLPSIFTALTEQLGLKLEWRQIPVDFLIIDHVERTPMEN
jgi:uncharacterized protein (TIGR03435 family)